VLERLTPEKRKRCAQSQRSIDGSNTTRQICRLHQICVKALCPPYLVIS
jgi:hypothetical protein